MVIMFKFDPATRRAFKIAGSAVLTVGTVLATPLARYARS